MSLRRTGAETVDWNEANINLLKRHWADGKSASEIVKIIGYPATRSSIIGKVHRLGLPQRAQDVKAYNNRRAIPKGAPKIKPQPAPVATPKPKPKLAIAENGSVYETAQSAPTLPPVNARAWSPLPGSAPVSLADLGGGQCKWPIDLPGATAFHFCARKADGPYCAPHTELAAPRTPGAKERLDKELGIAEQRRVA